MKSAATPMESKTGDQNKHLIGQMIIRRGMSKTNMGAAALPKVAKNVVEKVCVCTYVHASAKGNKSFGAEVMCVHIHASVCACVCV